MRVPFDGADAGQGVSPFLRKALQLADDGRAVSSADRWARMAIAACGAEHDLPTLDAWAKHVAVSRSSLRELCRLAVRTRPLAARDFVRLLRAVLRSPSQGADLLYYLDVRDARTHARLLRAMGSAPGQPLPTWQEFLARQQLIDRNTPGLRALRRLLERGSSCPPPPRYSAETAETRSSGTTSSKTSGSYSDSSCDSSCRPPLAVGQRLSIPSRTGELRSCHLTRSGWDLNHRRGSHHITGTLALGFIGGSVMPTPSNVTPRWGLLTVWALMLVLFGVNAYGQGGDLVPCSTAKVWQVCEATCAAYGYQNWSCVQVEGGMPGSFKCLEVIQIQLSEDPPRYHMDLNYWGPWFVYCTMVVPNI